MIPHPADQALWSFFTFCVPLDQADTGGVRHVGIALIVSCLEENDIYRPLIT